METAFLGIDPSYSGYATSLLYAGPDGQLSHETKLFSFTPAKCGVGPGRLFRVYSDLRDHFTAIRDTYDVRRVCLEGYAPASRFNRESLGELGGISRLALVQVWPPEMLTIVAPTALKKYVTGSGAAPKDTVLLQVYKKWGVEFANNDLADAYGLSQLARGLVCGTNYAYEDQVVKALRLSEENSPYPEL